MENGDIRAMAEMNKALNSFLWLLLLVGLPAACLLGFVSRGEDYLPTWWSSWGQIACGGWIVIRLVTSVSWYDDRADLRGIRRFLIGLSITQIPAAVFAVLELNDHPFWARSVEVYGVQDLAQRMKYLGAPLCQAIVAFTFGWPILMMLTGLIRSYANSPPADKASD